MKTHINKLRDPNFLGHWDLMDKKGNFCTAVLTIKGVKKEFVFDGKGGKEQCIILEFQETKPMILNATNTKTLQKNIGSPFIEDWNGTRIELTVERIKAFGEVHNALRISKGKEELSPEHPKWNSAKEAVKNKSVTIEQIKASYILSTENQNLLAQ
jgi:hypothetical protein